MITCSTSVSLYSHTFFDWGGGKTCLPQFGSSVFLDRRLEHSQMSWPGCLTFVFSSCSINRSQAVTLWHLYRQYLTQLNKTSTHNLTYHKSVFWFKSPLLTVYNWLSINQIQHVNEWFMNFVCFVCWIQCFTKSSTQKQAFCFLAMQFQKDDMHMLREICLSSLWAL